MSTKSNQPGRKFFVINEGFICKNCEHTNPPLAGSCRNHCQECLFSRHDDANFPGDRLSGCHGLMKPQKLDYKGQKGYIIIHQCLKCRHKSKNKVATDDNFDKIIELGKKNSPKKY